MILARASWLVLVGVAVAAFIGDLAAQWVTVRPGLEVMNGSPEEHRSADGGSLFAVRADPERFEVVVLSAATPHRTPLTADEWSRVHGLLLVANAGMYQEDGLTPMGHLRADTRDVARRWRKDYRAALVAGPLDERRPLATILDDACDGPLPIQAQGFRHVVQGIRMLTCRGENTFRPGGKRAVRLAVGVNGSGWILFVFARTPVTNHELVEQARARLDARRLMYLEGGSEASLLVRGPSRDLRLGGLGSSEVGRRLRLPEGTYLPIPNVIGLKPRGQGPDVSPPSPRKR